MVSFNKAQTGNRVYNGAGQAPNKGPVSAAGAQGYLKRELNNRNRNSARPVGGDGKSDSRSGVAARALRSMVGGGRPQAGGLKQPTRPGVMSNLPTAPPPPAANSNSPSGLPAPMIPQVQINANGILELPYDQNLSATSLAAVDASNADLMAIDQEEQQAKIEAMQNRNAALTQYGQLKTQTESGNASSGSLFSSMNGKNIVDNANAYTNTLAEISNREASATSDAATRRAAIQASLNQQLAEAAQTYANDMNENAGDYGFGQGYGQQGERNTGRHNGGSKKNPPKKNDPPKKNHGGPVKGKKR